MNKKIACLTFLALVGVGIAPLLLGQSAADDDPYTVDLRAERANSASATRATIPDAPLSNDGARSLLPSEPSARVAPPLDSPSAFATVDGGDLVVKNAKVEFPKGQGYEVTISSNGQGLVVELGLCATDENGDAVLGDDNQEHYVDFKIGQPVHKGQILGKQQDDELVQERIVAQQELLVAEKEAEKTLEIEVAEAAERVAQASYKRADSLNRAMPGSISQEEVQEKYYDWVRATKSIEKAKYDLEVNQEKVKVAAARVKASDVQIRNRKLKSPIDGVVDEVFVDKGEWVREGTPILHLVSLAKVRVVGAVASDAYRPEEINGKSVVVKTNFGDLVGKITYARQVVESGYYYFYADVDNKETEPGSGYWALNPGSLVDVVIKDAASR